MKKQFVTLLLIAFVACLGYAQQGDNGSSSPPPTTPPTDGSNSSSAATGTANAVVIQNSTSRPGFVSAFPGGVPGVYPGFAPEGAACSLYALQGLPPLTGDVIDSLAKGGKLPRGLRVVRTHQPNKNDTPYDGPIGLVRYNLRAHINPGDEILGTIIAPGVYLHPDEQLLGVALRALKKEVPLMQRAAIIDCPEVESVTKANTFGLGITTSGTPESGTMAGSGAVGFSHGTSKTGRQAHSTFYVYALNKGELNLIPPPQKAEVAPPPPPQPQPVAPVQTVRIEVVAVPPSQPVPPLAPVAIAPPVDECKLPQLNVEFEIDKYEIRPDGLLVILKLEDWLEKHPTCRVDVKGGACMHAGRNYNLVLAYNRAEAVRKLLNKNEKIRGQIVEANSHGKEQATLSGSVAEMKADRVVFFSVQGSNSH